jgi:hypothetical protein
MMVQPGQIASASANIVDALGGALKLGANFAPGLLKFLS